MTNKLSPCKSQALRLNNSATAAHVPLLTLLLLSGLVGCLSGGRPTNDAEQSPGDAAQGETQARCLNHNPMRSPFFGDLHVHTKFSLDTVAFDLVNSPAEAYAFARGETVRIGVPDAAGEPAFGVRLTRPLDFAAVTDHAEYLGETHICTNPSAAGYNSAECLVVRREVPGVNRPTANSFWQLPAMGSPTVSPPQPFCLLPGVDCPAAASIQWQETQRAAEDAYDRSERCTFTSFIAFEWTATPLGNNLHRNVIFRNEEVIPLPISNQDTLGPNVESLWASLEEQCLDADTGCDVLAIPHNPNLSNGMMFSDPASPQEAATRARLEPLVEMIQHKGSSECRLGVGTNDEQCAFENTEARNLSPLPTANSGDFDERSFIRNVLKAGLQLAPDMGVNPFKLGFVGSTDTHFGTPGLADETGHLGHHHVGDDQAAQLIEELDYNPGGLAVIWAEENSREALFEALRRRETYATSGTRPVLRVFGGWDIASNLCLSRGFEETGYADGVPMGGDLPINNGVPGGSPRFAVSALMDPHSQPLERLQMVKGWVDAEGASHEAVFDISGEKHSGLGVNSENCAPDGSGAPTLCTVWEDPDFDPTQPAFYYVRLLESPSCRWSTRLCQSKGVNPLSVQCSAQAELAGSPYEACCTDELIQPVIQERAWSSPIWYQPQ